MKNITDDMIMAGLKKAIRVFEQIEKLGQSDGKKATALKLLQEVYPTYDFYNVTVTLSVLQRQGYIEGLTIEHGTVVEPILPVITETGRKEIEDKKAALKAMEGVK